MFSLAFIAFATSSAARTDPQPLDAWWVKNLVGETIGVQRVGGPAPDLVPAVGNNGVKGYLRTSEMTWAPARTLEEAGRINAQHLRPNGDVVVKLYAIDGRTVIGEVTIGHASGG